MTLTIIIPTLLVLVALSPSIQNVWAVPPPIVLNENEPTELAPPKNATASSNVTQANVNGSSVNAVTGNANQEGAPEGGNTGNANQEGAPEGGNTGNESGDMTIGGDIGTKK